MSEIESAQFYLTSSTATKTLNNLGSTITFSNFNIYECLGEMYHKYNKFKLVLTGVSSFNINPITYRFLAIKMSGLDWINCLDYPSDNKTLATIGIHLCPSNVFGGSSASTNTQTYANCGCDFNKPSNNTVELTIYLHDAMTNGVSTTQSYGLNTFFFTIYGIK